jgi:hypothetical protein
MRRDAPGSQIDRAPPRAHATQGALRGVSRELPDADDSTAYYTDNLEDAINAAVEMARKRALSADAAKSALRTGERRTEP